MAEANDNTRRNAGAGRWSIALTGLIAAAASMAGCSSSDPDAKLTDEEGAALLTRVRENPPKPDDLTVGEKKWLKDYWAQQHGRR